MGRIIFRVCFKRPFFNRGLGDANLEGQGLHILAVMEWYGLNLHVKFNDRNLTMTATAR